MEYGGFLLFSFIVGFVVGVFDVMLFIDLVLGEISGLLLLVVIIVMFVLGIMVIVRCFYDMGCLVWWMLLLVVFMVVMVGLGVFLGSVEMIMLLLIVGIIFNIVFLFWFIFKDS